MVNISAPGGTASRKRSDGRLVTSKSATSQVLISQRVDTAAQVAFEAFMRPSTRLVAAGLTFLFGPPIVIVLAPLLLLLLPLLLALGLVLTIAGLAQLGIVVSFAHISTVQHFATRTVRASAASAAPEQPPELVHRSQSACALAPAPSTAAEADALSDSVHTKRIDGSLATLAKLNRQRVHRLVRRVTQALRHNVSRAKADISGEVEQQLAALQRELRLWVGANQNLKPYCHGRIGWLLKQEQHAGVDLSNRFQDLLQQLLPTGQPLSTAATSALPFPAGVPMQSLRYLLVPGLLTKWYPKYMAHLRNEFKRLGLHVTFSRVDTDQPVRVNAARIRHEVLELSESGNRIAILGHSKGAVDAAAALSLFPELCDAVAALVSVQGPHGGSAIAHDLAHTQIQRSLALSYVLEKLLRGCKHAVLDLSFSARQDFMKRHPYPLSRVPTLCLASSDRRPSSLLKPIIDFLALRYGEWSDGCVCQVDAVLPGCARVFVDDMDHFGPAWPSFPATDRYDPTRLWLLCTALALNQQQQRALEPPLVKIPSSASACSLTLSPDPTR